MAVSALLILGSIASGAQQHPRFQHGDVIGCGRTPGQFFGYGRWEWYLPDGTLNLRMAEALGNYPQDVALDPAGNAYFPRFSFPIVVFDTNGRFLKSFPQFSTFASSIVFDRVGNAYFTNGGQTVLKTTSAGSLLQSFSLPRVVGAIDLAADQCTLYYTGFNGVLRYDLCRDAELPDFTSPPPAFRAARLRILPDGGVLVTASDIIVRLDNAGKVVQTYDAVGADNWLGLALDVDGRSFWATSWDQAYRFDLESGDVLTSFRTVNDRPSAGPMFFTAIAIVGEPRAALAPLSIPALSNWLLLVLIALIAGVAVWRLHH